MKEMKRNLFEFAWPSRVLSETVIVQKGSHQHNGLDRSTKLSTGSVTFIIMSGFLSITLTGPLVNYCKTSVGRLTCVHTVSQSVSQSVRSHVNQSGPVGVAGRGNAKR